MREEVEFIGGVEKRDIHVVTYDPSWPRRFAQERARIAAALGATALRVDHIGSTSVPGLSAKPIIDIDLSVPDVEDEPSYVDATQDWPDMTVYADAKGPLIAELTEHAEAWAKAEGWQP